MTSKQVEKERALDPEHFQQSMFRLLNEWNYFKKKRKKIITQ